MKRFIFFLLLFFSVARCFSQCNNCNGQWPSTLQTITCGSGTQVISTCMFGGEYAACSVVVGNTYTWSTCSSTYDTQLSLFSGACGNAGTFIAYNDDACALQSTIVWTATFTGSVYVLVSQYNCISNTICTTLDWSCTGSTPPPPPPGPIMACSGNFYDTGGPSGPYSAGQNYTVTYCPSTPGARVSMNFTFFDLENGFDFLTIYDGSSTAAPNLGTYTGVVGPGTVTATPSNPTGCLTFVFVSDFIVQYGGWAAAISCISPCQTIQSVLVSSSPPPGAGGIIRVCQGQTVTFQGAGSFSNSGAGATFLWNFGNGATSSGANASYTFLNPGGYTVNLTVTDPSGCTNGNLINQVVQVSTTPSIVTSANPSTICQGQTAQISASVVPTTYQQNCTPPVSGVTFLPDGTGVSYSTSIQVNCYASNQQVQSVSDIQNVCLEMEHSYIGDLSINLICPNGQSVNLKPFPSGGGTYLGCPLDDPAVGPGVGATYCFTPSAATLLVNGTTITCGNPPWNSVVPGNYMPAQPFSSLIGCPLNGQWTIQVVDNLGADNGYIFDWDVNFNPALQPPAATFTPTVATQGWLSATGLSSVSNVLANVTPSVPGTSCYTYQVTDNFGCTYSQVQCVNVTPGTAPVFNAVPPFCQGSPAPVLPPISNNGISGTWSPSTVSNTSSGTYIFTPSVGQCASPYTLNITVTAPPSISPVFHD